MLSLSQLRNPPTRSEVVSWSLETLRELGFQTTGWQEGRIQNTLLNAFGTVVSGVLQVVADHVEQSYNSTATGAGLTLLALNRFSNERSGALKAAGPFLFNNIGTIAHSVEVGSLVVRDPNGIEFTNIQAGTIPAGGSVLLNMEAVLAGSDGSIPNNSTLTLVTPKAGTTVTNPGPGDVNGDGFPDPWYTIRTGTDPETDIALRQRNASKWGLLSVEKTATAYVNLALAQQGVNKVRVIDDNPRGAGTVDVYVANGGNLLSTGDKELAQAAFAARTFGTDSAWPPGNLGGFPSTVYIKDPLTLELDIEGSIYYDPQFTLLEVQANVTQALNDFVALMPMGGIEYESGEVTVGDITEVLEGTPGVRSITLTAVQGGTPGDIDMQDTTLLTAPADWITGKLAFTAVTT